MVDVFTILPRAENGATNESRRGRRDEHRPETPDNSKDGYKPSPVSLKQYKIDDGEEARIPQEMAYRSVKKVPQGQGAKSVSNAENNWEAAKAVMG